MRPAGMLPKYDGPNAANDRIMKERDFLYHYYDGRCQVCGRPLDYNTFSVSHCIADTKPNRHKWGKDVINHWKNHLPTCRTNNCNDACNCGNNPAKCAEIVAMVRGE
jgi:hypothetical protein